MDCCLRGSGAVNVVNTIKTRSSRRVIAIEPDAGQLAAISVIVRIRPPNASEISTKSASVVDVSLPQTITMLEDPAGRSKATVADRTFAFDAVHASEANQGQVYASVAPLLGKVMSGFNAVIAAYGQTGSGKTYSMMGGISADALGIMPRLAKQLMAGIDASYRGNPERGAAQPPLEWTIEASYIECYMEQLRDLLGKDVPTVASPPSRGHRASGVSPVATPVPAPPSEAPLHASRRSSAGNAASAPGATILLAAGHTLSGGGAAGAGSQAVDAAADGGGGPVIRERPGGEIVLEGATRRVLRRADDVLDVLAEGALRRAQAETSMNATSSRSHGVLTLYLTQRQRGDEDGATAKSSKLHLIDLAGSERADATGATGVRLKEGAKINQSLSALGNVISALTTPGRTHVPFRDSKLTRLLQDSLGGNAFTTLVCCVSPAGVNYDETLSTLRFAERAKRVTSVVRVNRDGGALAVKLQQVQAENARLQAQLAATEGLLARLGHARELEALRGGGLASPPPSACNVM